VAGLRQRLGRLRRTGVTEVGIERPAATRTQDALVVLIVDAAGAADQR
jgi:hypothetical protein